MAEAVSRAARRGLWPLATLSVLVVLIGPLLKPIAAGAMPPLYLPPACQTVTYHSEPQLYAQRVCMNTGVVTHGTEPGTYLFLTPHDAGSGIFKDDGTLVWWHSRPPDSTEEYDLSVIHLWGHPYLAAYAGHAQLVGNNRVFINDGEVLLYNQRYQQVGEIDAGPPFAGRQVDMHEFRLTPDGDALIGIYDPAPTRVNGHAEIVVQYVVQKLSLVRDSSGIHTGKVLFQWRSLGHVPVSQSHLPAPGPGGAWDYFHGNAIAQDTDGNLIVSARNTWGIYKINAHTGRIMWEVGAKGDRALRLPWCYQHDVSALGHGEYSLFDDGAIGQGCESNGTWHPSRGVIFRVNAARRAARVHLVRAYVHRPRIHSGFLGSVQRLPDSDVLVGWGNVPEITQYSPDGRRVLMDLSISQQSFRGYRFGWVGRPAAPPDVAAQFRGAGTRIWASWNGATQVRAWRVLGGLAPTDLKVIGKPVPRAGFETSILLKQHYTYVAVQALNGHARVLGTSSTVVAQPAGNGS